MPRYKIVNSTTDPVPFKVLAGFGVQDNGNVWHAWLQPRQAADLKKMYGRRLSVRKERLTSK